MSSDLQQKAAALRATQAPAQEQRDAFDEGQLLAAIPRGDREELRIAWAEYKGHPFLSIRLWSVEGGKRKPTAKGITIKVKELADVADAIGQALDLAFEHQTKRGHRT